MSTVSRMIARLLLLLALVFCSCDFQGPWSYYPEETAVYQGIYTYGYIVADESPYVCFSKVYSLKESSAENFAFYDSANVTISGKFSDGKTEVDMGPVDRYSKPNCFHTYVSSTGIPGESYTLKAFFKWDSAGHTVESEFKAVAKIPTKLKAKGIVPPSMGKPTFVPNDYKRQSFKHLDFPFDVLSYKIPLDFDESVRGVLTTMGYDNKEGGESMNNTINGMMGSLVEPDSLGYTGISLISPNYNETSLGYTTRMSVGGLNTLDTFEFTGMTTPIGEMVIRFYATDQAYSDYKNTVISALDDPRIKPKSNVENGMGVFSGMYKDSLLMEVTAEDYVPFDHIQKVNCANTSYDPDSVSSKACRLLGESVCIDTVQCVEGCGYKYEVNQEMGMCYPMAVKLAMSLDTNKWSLFLPDTLAQKKKDEAYADGLKRYCVANNFKNNSLAKCDDIYNDCQVAPEKNYCKKYLWQWCSDRDWDMLEYPQCGTGLVSRYIIEKMKSSILERVVKSWCKENPKDKQCSHMSS